MAASYPGAIKNFSAVVNGVTKLVASLFNVVYDEVTAIETELGTDPAGSVADLKTRLAVSINDDGTLKGIMKIGTYTGSGASPKVVAHGLGATPTICIITAGNTGTPVIYVNGQAQRTGDGNDVDVALDGTNITITGVTASTPNESGITYYFIVIKSA